MASKSGIESGIENSTLLKYLQIKGVIGVGFGFQH